jgi:hypothetical protein
VVFRRDRVGYGARAAIAASNAPRDVEDRLDPKRLIIDR